MSIYFFHILLEKTSEGNIKYFSRRKQYTSECDHILEDNWKLHERQER